MIYCRYKNSKTEFARSFCIIGVDSGAQRFTIALNVAIKSIAIRKSVHLICSNSQQQLNANLIDSRREIALCAATDRTTMIDKKVPPSFDSLTSRCSRSLFGIHMLSICARNYDVVEGLWLSRMESRWEAHRPQHICVIETENTLLCRTESPFYIHSALKSLINSYIAI